MITGIYCIENQVNGKKYIGKSVDIIQRFRTHKKKLKNNTHENPYLQNSRNKYGDDCFLFYIIEECEDFLLDEKEKYYISYFDSKTNGYNLTDGGEGVLNPCQQTRKRMSDAQKGKKASDETRALLSDIHRNISDETRKKMSIAKSNMSDETKKKISESGKGRIPWNKGIPQTQDVKEKISNSVKKSVTPEYRERSRQNAKNMIRDDDYKKTMSESLKRMWDIKKEEALCKAEARKEV